MKEELNKIKNLMERLEHPYGRLLYEATGDAAERRVATSNELFDLLDKMPGGWRVTMGYVTGANINAPKDIRINPATKRKKGYDNYSVFKNEGDDREIGALVRVTTYNWSYRTRGSVGDDYNNRYVPAANAIYDEFGLPHIKPRENPWSSVQDYGENGIEHYSGNNEEKAGNTYHPQNMHGVKPTSVTYAIDTDGHKMYEIPNDKLIPYLKKSAPPTGVAALRKMGAEEEKVQELISRLGELKMKYRQFEDSSILFISATVKNEDGSKEKIVYINDRLSRCVNDINIAPEDFIQIANERYNKDVKPQ